MADYYYLICDETKQCVEIGDYLGTPYEAFIGNSDGYPVRIEETKPVGYEQILFEDDGRELMFQEKCGDLEVAVRYFLAAFDAKRSPDEMQKATNELREVHKQTVIFLRKEGGYRRFSE